MDVLRLIGKLLNGIDVEQDAIHVAVVPVVAGEDRLWRGNPLRLAYPSKEVVLSANTLDDENCLGVVDPFLEFDIQLKKGDRFFCFVKPGLVVDLRHDYRIPLLDAQAVPTCAAEDWLRRFACRWNVDYARMLREAQQHGGVFVANGIDLHSAGELDPGDEEKFWECVEAVTARSFAAEHRAAFYWSCSC